MTDSASRVRARVSPESVELHRRQCEARYYARMPGRERKAALDRIEKVRGEKLAEQLADDIRRLRQEARA